MHLLKVAKRLPGKQFETLFTFQRNLVFTVGICVISPLEVPLGTSSTVALGTFIPQDLHILAITEYRLPGLTL